MYWVRHSSSTQATRVRSPAWANLYQKIVNFLLKVRRTLANGRPKALSTLNSWKTLSNSTENVFRTVGTVRKTFSVLLVGVFRTVHILIYSVENEINSAFPSNCSTQKVIKIKKRIFTLAARCIPSWTTQVS